MTLPLEFSVGAVVLCGGRSSRMGRPKAWLPFGDEVLLQRIVRRLAAVCRPLVVVASAGQSLPPLQHVRVVRDPIAEQGPLQGIAAGLAALADEVEHAFVCATDAPFLCAELVAALVTLRGQHDAVVPRTDGHLQLLAGLYACSLRERAEQLLARGQRRVGLLLQEANVREVPRSKLLQSEALRRADPNLLCLHNLNTPDDYQRALTRAGLDPEPSSNK